MAKRCKNTHIDKCNVINTYLVVYIANKLAKVFTLAQ